MARAWAVLTRPSAIAADEHVVALQCLGEAEVGAGSRRTCLVSIAIQSAAVSGTGVGGGTGPVGLGEQSQLECVELCLGLGEGGQRLALLARASSTRAAPGDRVEPFAQPVGEVEHRVEVVDRLAAHESIQAPSTDRKGPLTCGFAHSVRRPEENFGLL